MKKLFIVLLIILTITGFIFAEAIGEIVEMRGRAVVIRTDGTEDNAAVGLDILKGDKVKTFFASVVKVRLKDESEITVNPGTTIDFNNVDVGADGSKNVEMNLWFGKGRVQVSPLRDAQSTFEVKTPTAVCGVRGTDFGVGVDPTRTTRIGVFSGKVAVRSAGGGREVLVQQNQTTTVEPNQEPEAPTEMNEGDKLLLGYTDDKPAVEENFIFSDVYEERGALIQITGDLPGITNQRSVQIRGTVQEGIKVTVNDEEISVSGGLFTTDIMLVEGLNKLTITAISPDGQKQTIEREIILSTIAPTYLQIVRPSNFEYGHIGYYNRSNLPIIGFIEVGNKVRINNIPVEIDRRGQFRINLPLQTGRQRIKIEVEDPAGNIYTRYSGLYNVDYEPPVLSITYPIENQIISQNIISVTGRTEAGATLYIRLDGREVETVEAIGETFNANINVSREGEYIVAVYAEDQAGNRSRIVQRRVRVDLYPPVLTLIKKEIDNQGNMQLTVKSNERLQSATAAITGNQLNYDSSYESNNNYYYTWTIPIMLNPGSSVIIRGTDFANKTSTVVF